MPLMGLMLCYLDRHQCLPYGNGMVARLSRCAPAVDCMSPHHRLSVYLIISCVAFGRNQKGHVALGAAGIGCSGGVAGACITFCLCYVDCGWQGWLLGCVRTARVVWPAWPLSLLSASVINASLMT